MDNKNRERMATIYAGLIFIVLSSIIGGLIYLIYVNPTMAYNGMYIFIGILIGASVLFVLMGILHTIYDSLRLWIYQQLRDKGSSDEDT